jgi:hypothetical protein
MSKAKLLACLVGAIVSCLLAVAAQSAEETYTLKTIVPVPGGLTSFDIAFVDANINTFVLADRTNKSIDVVDTRTNTMTHQRTASPPFVGIVASPANASGPNGVMIVDQREIWATDGPVIGNCTPSPTGLKCTGPVTTPSSIKVIDLKTGAMIANIPNGGTRRADELCDDVKHEMVLVANDDPADNFLTFIDAESHSIIGTTHKLDGSDPNFKITLTGVTLPTHSKVAADGIEQCKFNPRTGSYYLAVPATAITDLDKPLSSTNPSPGPGVVLRISRRAPFHIEETITVPASTGCQGPQGLAIGPRHEIQLGCGGANSVIIDDRSGPLATIISTETGEGGADEVWYNPGNNSFFIARSGAGKLGVQDAGGNESALPQPDADVTTAIGSHVVAADMQRNEIYVPIRSTTFPANPPTVSTICSSKGGVDANGCIAVFTAPKDDECLAQGMPVLDHDDGDDPVFMRTRCRDHDDDDHDRVAGR